MPSTRLRYKNTVIDESAQPLPINIRYGDITVAQVSPGETKTLKCSGKLMLSMVRIGTRILNVANKHMETDIAVEVEPLIQLNVPTITGTYTYNGEIITPTVSSYDHTKIAVSGDTSGKNAGEYEMIFSLVDKDSYVWSDGTQTDKTVNWQIAVRELAVPTIDNYQFTSGVITPSISGFNATYSYKNTDKGIFSATNVGEYNAVFTLNDGVNLKWAGKTQGIVDITVSWAITPRIVTIPTLSGTYTYNGTVQNVTVNDLDSTFVRNVSDTQLSGTNAGEYTAKWELIYGNGSTTWSDGTTGLQTKKWIINQMSLTRPTIKGSYTYSGSEQTAQWNNYIEAYMTLGGNYKGTNAGDYTATFTLKDSQNTKWASGSDPVSVSWTIAQANGYVTLQTTGTQSIANGATGTNTVLTNHGGTLSVSNGGSSYCDASISGTTISVVHKGNTGSSAKTVTITVTCAANTNYKQATATYSVSLAKSSCVTGDTLVLMGDGVTEKQIRDIELGESVMTWNMIKGEYEPQPVSVVYDENAAICLRTLHLHFSNGKTIKIAGEHGFFDYTVNNYSYIEEENYEQFIGHEFVIYKNGEYDLTTLIGAEIVDNVAEEIWSLQTAFNENFVTEGVLGITQEYKPGRYEYFDFGEGIRWDAEKMQEDIERYGLFTYDEWKDFVSEEDFYTFNGPWFKILIGKGIIELEDIAKMIAITPSLAGEE